MHDNAFIYLFFWSKVSLSSHGFIYLFFHARMTKQALSLSLSLSPFLSLSYFLVDINAFDIQFIIKQHLLIQLFPKITWIIQLSNFIQGLIRGQPQESGSSNIKVTHLYSIGSR